METTAVFSVWSLVDIWGQGLDLESGIGVAG